MASILDRYGIKEVADVTFYDIDPITGDPGKPVLYLDTLKVSTIEQTSETADARGGKGNPKLVSWDYGKEINVTLEDALFSAKSLSIMFGDGTVTHNSSGIVHRTTVAKYKATGSYFMADVYKDGGAVRQKIWLVENDEAIPAGQEGVSLATSGVKIVRFTDEDGSREQTYTKAAYTDWTSFVAGTSGDKVTEGQKVFITYELSVSSSTVLVSADSFPGTYYITGDTYARSDVTGKDQFFQFIIPKAKVTSENTITLEAEGDPSVFNMSLTVLRPDSGEMMKLVQYELSAG